MRSNINEDIDALAKKIVELDVQAQQSLFEKVAVLTLKKGLAKISRLYQNE